MKKPVPLKAVIAAASIDRVPPGWFTAKEIAAQEGAALGSISPILAKGLKLRLLKRRVFRIMCGARRNAYPVPHYFRLR